MSRLLIVLLLAGCATTAQPELPADAETSAAAIGTVAFWRWAGRAVITMINSVSVKVEVKEESK